MEHNPPRVLVVDDEETLCEVLRLNLSACGYEVDVAYSAEQALMLDLSYYSLIILDVMMEEISGLQLVRIVKGNPKTRNVPIILCTARDTEEDIVSGLDLGADDYVTKPFTVRGLMARVRSVLRRYGSNPEIVPAPVEATTVRNGAIQPTPQRPNGLFVDDKSKRCYVHGRELHLRKKEFEILSLLIAEPGRIFSRDEIMNRVWRGEAYVLDRTIDVNITRLRQMLGDLGKCIVTRQGYGYGYED